MNGFQENTVVDVIYDTVAGCESDDDTSASVTFDLDSEASSTSRPSWANNSFEFQDDTVESSDCCSHWSLNETNNNNTDGISSDRESLSGSGVILRNGKTNDKSRLGLPKFKSCSSDRLKPVIAPKPHVSRCRIVNNDTRSNSRPYSNVSFGELTHEKFTPSLKRNSLTASTDGSTLSNDINSDRHQGDNGDTSNLRSAKTLFMSKSVDNLRLLLTKSKRYDVGCAGDGGKAAVLPGSLAADDTSTAVVSIDSPTFEPDQIIVNGQTYSKVNAKSKTKRKSKEVLKQDKLKNHYSYDETDSALSANGEGLGNRAWSEKNLSKLRKQLKRPFSTVILSALNRKYNSISTLLSESFQRRQQHMPGAEDDDVYNDPGFEDGEFEDGEYDDDYTNPDEHHLSFAHKPTQRTSERRPPPMPPAPNSPESDDDYLAPEHDKPLKEPVRPGGRGGKPPAPPPGTMAPPRKSSPVAGRRPPPPVPEDPGPPARESRPPPPVPKSSVVRKPSTNSVPPTPVRVGTTAKHTSVPEVPKSRAKPLPAVEQNNNEAGEEYGVIDDDSIEPAPPPGGKSFLFSKQREIVEKSLQAKTVPKTQRPPPKRPAAVSPPDDSQQTYEAVDSLPSPPDTKIGSKPPPPPPNRPNPVSSPAEEPQMIYEAVDLPPPPPETNKIGSKPPPRLPTRPSPTSPAPEEPQMAYEAVDVPPPPSKAKIDFKPPPPPPNRPIPAPRPAEEAQVAYEAVDLPPPPPETKHGGKLKPQHIPVQQEETYEPLPDDDEYTQDEYALADVDEPPVPEVPRSRVPAQPAVRSPTSPPAVKGGVRFGDTATLNIIKSRPLLKTTTFHDKPPQKEEKKVFQATGVKALAQQMEGVLGGGMPKPVAPKREYPHKPMQPPPVSVSPAVVDPPSQRSTQFVDAGRNDTGYESGAPIGDRISSLSTSSNSTSGSRDSCESNARFPPALPPRTEMPLPPPPANADILSEPWYRPDLSREKANAAVTNAGRHGSFLIRDSKKMDSQPYTLVVLYQSSLKNIPIRKRFDGKYAFGKEKENETTFYKVKEMVDYHKTSGILLDGGGEVTLKHPVTK